MILYFADRQLNILGHASTELPEGLTADDDLKAEDIDTGVAVFECIIHYDKNTRAKVESCTELGNYILRSHENENEFYTIIDAEIDTKKQTVYVYAEDAGLDLLNEVFGPYEADKAYAIDHYINKFAYDSGFEIGVNEAAGLTRKLSWDGNATATERIASVATQFGGFEISYGYDIDGLEIVKKYINIHKERGQDNGVQLRLNKEIDRIITKKSISNLATALECKGGTPENEENPITLDGYSYDDGDFFVRGSRLYSREAQKKWTRYKWAKEPNQLADGEGHIVGQFEYDTTDKGTLCAHAITELKKLREPEVNYEVDFTKLPEGTKVGDWVNIIDDEGEVYVSARILLLEVSVANNTKKVTLGEYLIRSSGISQKVAELAAKFAATSQSAAKALVVTNNALEVANEAQKYASSSSSSSAAALEIANAAKEAATAAQEKADVAKDAADNAQAAVDNVEKDVASLETSVSNAQTAANNAQAAADTADAKATEAGKSAAQALADAADAKAAVEVAQTTANTAVEKADAAQSTANTAKADAATAQETAEAAKLDAEKANEDIATLGERLDTISSTMEADYARKTELTETESKLQSQISQNAAQISSIVSQVTTIDETANNAQEQAQAAKSAADTAQAQADQATADAEAAQTAADNAAAAAANAQTEADNAKAAAATAQSVADKAEADLEAAKADLATVTSRVGATEADIVAAQQAVETAQTAADEAKANAQTATEKANTAQITANTAVTDAANAQSAANEAASNAAAAQALAEEAKGNAAAAQTAADEAAATAAEAQRTADNAVTNAANAQSTANAAAQAAEKAQAAADEADAKAAQAATDLATAKQNLSDVTSRVDATEEEVEAAQAAVATAQAAADKAHEEAEAAQATADTAKANAATAQTAANNAKTAADAAQAAADEAQQAADEAQAAVDALAVRVTTAETKITQNSEQIALMATKEEVTTTLGGYYTKEETEAAIKLESDSIKSTVSSTYATKTELSNTNAKIGEGGNLLINGKPSSSENWGLNHGVTYEDGYFSVPAYTPTTEGGHGDTISQGFANRIPFASYERKFKIRFDAKDASGGNQTGHIALWLRWKAEDGSQNWPAFDLQMSKLTSSWATYSGTITIPADRMVDAFGIGLYTTSAFCIRSLYLEEITDLLETKDEIANVQGSVDVTNERVTSAESVIQQLANCIATLVTDGNGESLMTQTEDGWTFNMAQISDTLDSATADIDTLTESLGGVDNTVNALQQAVADLGILSDYVIINTYENQPCIELGEAENGFKLRITNTQIQFLADGTIPAWLSNQKLFIEKAEVTDELQFGGFVWKARSNGNMGLMWKGVSS